MTVITQKELEDLFWKATTMTLGLEPDADEEYIQKRVRISWPQSDTGNSDWRRDENVIFLRISPTPDDYTTLKDISHEYDREKDDMKEVVEYHRCYSINWVCYGPDSAADADAIRIGILRDPIKAFLRKSKVAIIPAIREPVRLPRYRDLKIYRSMNTLSLHSKYLAFVLEITKATMLCFSNISLCLE